MQNFEKIKANILSLLNLNYTLSPMCMIMSQKKGKKENVTSRSSSEKFVVMTSYKPQK